MPISNSWEQVVSPLLSRARPLAPRSQVRGGGLPVAGCLPSPAELREPLPPARPGRDAPLAEVFLNVRVLAPARLDMAGMRSCTGGPLVRYQGRLVPGGSRPREGDGVLLSPTLPTAFPAARPAGGSRAFSRASLIRSEWRIVEPPPSVPEGSTLPGCGYRARWTIEPRSRGAA